MLKNKPPCENVLLSENTCLEEMMLAASFLIIKNYLPGPQKPDSLLQTSTILPRTRFSPDTPPPAQTQRSIPCGEHAGERGTLRHFTEELARLRPNYRTSQRTQSEPGQATSPGPAPLPSRLGLPPAYLLEPRAQAAHPKSPAAQGTQVAHTLPRKFPPAEPPPYLSMDCGTAKPVCSDMAPGRKSGPSRRPGA
ncbi:protein piccolo-like [Lathamus discolor]|uniref:protein piccolo-like n=1 Tax=Lathamus discolor TaxID=678569 RepID=UPI0032B7A2DD